MVPPPKDDFAEIRDNRERSIRRETRLSAQALDAVRASPLLTRPAECGVRSRVARGAVGRLKADRRGIISHEVAPRANHEGIETNPLTFAGDACELVVSGLLARQVPMPVLPINLVSLL